MRNKKGVTFTELIITMMLIGIVIIFLAIVAGDGCEKLTAKKQETPRVERCQTACSRIRYCDQINECLKNCFDTIKSMQKQHHAVTEIDYTKFPPYSEERNAWEYE